MLLAPASRPLGGSVIQKTSTQQVIVDITVMHDAIAHPTDSCLVDKSHQHLVEAAHDHGLQLRQNYKLVASHCQGLAC